MSIQCKQLTKRFGNLTAVDHVSVTLEREKIYGLLGRNVPRYEQKTLSIT